MCQLILLRGLPGAGKTTVSELIEGRKICADDCWSWDYTTDPRGFDPKELQRAHERCYERTRQWMLEKVPRIIVHNTLTTEFELSVYYTLARLFNYQVHSLIVEGGRHSGTTKHNVPEKVLEKMKKRFCINL